MIRERLFLRRPRHLRSAKEADKLVALLVLLLVLDIAHDNVL